MKTLNKANIILPSFITDINIYINKYIYLYGILIYLYTMVYSVFTSIIHR